jgi:hypothetical protein
MCKAVTMPGMGGHVRRNTQQSRFLHRRLYLTQKSISKSGKMRVVALRLSLGS